jgi:uncharacterized protein (DUF302 family)
MRSMAYSNNSSARLLAVLALGSLLGACGAEQPASQDLYQAVDGLYDSVSARASAYTVITEIDHSRLAGEAGEVMPPARVMIFSDPELNATILQEEPLAGLDLPFRVLAYAEGTTPRIISTPADFLKRRYGLADEPGMAQYDAQILDVLAAAPRDAVTTFDVSALEADQGIVTLTSKYSFEETIERLKDVILAEGDTLWFGEIDFQAEAGELGAELPPLTLLLYGAPGPGAKAMADFPRLGLDAFCQKLLVYQPEGEPVRAVFNDLTALAELHYGDTALPHKVISRRIKSTLGGAIEE